jgi:hypothetical protein
VLRTTAWLIAALAAGLVAGCGKQPVPEAGAGTGSTAAGVQDDGDGQSRDGAAAADDGVFAPLLDDVERARGVQQTVDEQAERLRREIEKAEGAAEQ